MREPLHLLAPGDPVAAADLYDRPRRRADGRPWVAVNMVVSLDGATAVGGLSGGLGGAGDKAVFDTLRGVADVVLAGRGTVEAEGYRPRARRDRWLAVVSASADLRFDLPLWTSPTTVLVTVESASVPDHIPTIRAGTATVDLPVAVERLGALVSGRTGRTPLIVCEGGPTLNGAVVAAGLVDEWCLTIASVLVGGSSDRPVTGGAELHPPADLQIVSVARAPDGLFIRAVRHEHV